jgi:hypothetical protein
MSRKRPSSTVATTKNGHDSISNDKARRELEFRPRPLEWI